jgi:hypothetical protein
MALGAFGDLVLALSADTAKFEAALSKAARDAEKELQKIVVIGSAVGSAIGDGIAQAARAMARFATDTVRTQSQLDDLADTVGGNVTQLDGLRRIAFVAGSDLNFLNTALMNLSRGLRASSDEGNATVRAVKALGLNLEELRRMAPDQAMRAIAVAMNQFADGGEKAAAAQALFKGAAKEALPILKDLAEASDTTGKKTREQVEQSERLEKETRRLSLAFHDARDDLANLLIPTLADYLEQLREGTKISGGFFASLKLFGTINPFRSLGGNIQEFTKDLEQLEAARKDFAGRPGYEGQVAGLDQSIEDTKKRIEFLKMMQRQEAMALAGPGSLDARDLAANPPKQKLDFVALDEEERRKARKLAEEAERERLALLKLAAKSETDYLLAQQEEIEFNDTLIRQAAFRNRAEREKLEALGRQSEINDLLAQQARLEERDDQIRTAALRERKQETKELNDFAKSLGLTFSSAFEDAIIKGLSFRDVLKGIEQDIARIILRKGVTEPMANWIGAGLSGMFGGGAAASGGGAPGMALGGPVSAGMPYTVGEHGPELFVPSMSGTVIPNDSLGGSVSIYQTINVDSRSDQASIAMAMQRAKDAAVAEVTARQQRRGDARIG